MTPHHVHNSENGKGVRDRESSVGCVCVGVSLYLLFYRPTNIFCLFCLYFSVYLVPIVVVVVGFFFPFPFLC